MLEFLVTLPILGIAAWSFFNKMRASPEEPEEAVGERPAERTYTTGTLIAKVKGVAHWPWYKITGAAAGLLLVAAVVSTGWIAYNQNKNVLPATVQIGNQSYEVSSAVPYRVPAILIGVALLLFLFRAIAKSVLHENGVVTERSGGSASRRKGLLIWALGALLLYFGWRWARDRWEAFERTEAQRRAETAQVAAMQLEAARIASLPPPGAWIATNRYKMWLVSVDTGDFTVYADKPSRPFRVTSGEQISFGNRSKIRVFRDGVEVPAKELVPDARGYVQNVQTETGAATYTIMAKRGSVRTWVAIGLPFTRR